MQSLIFFAISGTLIEIGLDGIHRVLRETCSGDEAHVLAEQLQVPIELKNERYAASAS